MKNSLNKYDLLPELLRTNCLNDRPSKKDLGAFYTPAPYAKKAAELVQMAVDRVPDGNDYIILDRCAGTGNLEAALIGLKDKNGDDLISHCVVSTYEYYEYKVLQERIGCDVREIIPPTEANVVYENGRVANADAMSEDFINNPIIKQYIDNPKCSVILFENPPYQDSTSVLSRNEKNNCAFAKSRAEKFVAAEMRRGVINRDAVRDLVNQFIWSGFHYYLRQSTDSYVVFSPIKYWKYVGLVEKDFVNGFLFNRKHFHATASTISCILWVNTNNYVRDKLIFTAFDVDGGNNVLPVAEVTTAKCHTSYDVFKNKGHNLGDEETSVYCARDGSETRKKPDCKSYYNENIVGFLGVPSFAIDQALCRILIRQNYFHHGMGYYIHKEDYLKHLPLFAGKSYPIEKWYEKDIYATTSDGGDAYTKDKNFLKSCLIYTCLSNQNKCLSFDGSDGRRYQNELCFDGSRACTPLALADLRKYKANKKTALDEEEQKLINLWNNIMSEARKTINYNPNFNYGVYQIKKELNTSKVVGTGKNKKTVYDYPVLNGYLDTLRTMLKAYYKSHITEKMFKYELIK